MDEGLKQRVQDRYAEAARSVLGEAEDGGACCGSGASCCGVAESGERAAFEVDMACGSALPVCNRPAKVHRLTTHGKTAGCMA